MPADNSKNAEEVYTLAYKIGKEWRLSTRFFNTFQEAFHIWIEVRGEKLLGDAMNTYFGGVPPEDVVVVSMTRGSSAKVTAK